MQPDQLSRRVSILQRYLMKLGYLDQQETSLRFDAATAQALCAYQVKIMGLAADSPRCGRFGPQTRASLSAYVRRQAVTLPEESVVEEPVNLPTTVLTVPTESLSATSSVVALGKGGWLFAPGGEFSTYRFSSVLRVGDTSHEVRVLQRKLQWLGYYSAAEDISGVYDEETIRAVFAFQLHEGIIEPTADPKLFGYFGPKTRAKLNSI